MRAPWAIVCDFDGTATTEDIGDRICLEFAGAQVWHDAVAGYQQGAYDFAGLLRRFFGPVRATRDELAAFAREHAVLRPGFERLVARCQQAGAPFVLCSAGLDVYIEPVLERLPRALRAHVQVRCNGATCSPEGLAMTFHGAGTPLEADGCGACGFCKAAIVRELQAAGYQVVGIGDGTSDRCLAPAADVLFARGRLTEYCRARAIPFTPFETFDEVLAHLPPRAKRSLSG